jgi:hypothetical protein
MIKNIVKAMHTQQGKYLISIILGIGLASLFRKACNKRNCLMFKAPPIDEVRGNIYSHDDKCYRFKEKATKCSKSKKRVEFA